MHTNERIVFDSFFHSQGDTFLQSLILKWMAVHEDMPYDDSLDTITSLAPRLERYALSGQHNVPPTEQTVEDTVGGLVGEPVIEDLAFIGRVMIHGDLRSLDRRIRTDRKIYQGRENASHVALFGLQRATTGVEAYDRMYEGVFSDYRPLTDQTDTPDNLNSFYHLLNIHNMYNPQDTEGLGVIIGRPIPDSPGAVIF